MDISEETKAYLKATAASLNGHDRRLFLARTVRWLGVGGQRQAERELGWNRVTIVKDMHELTSGNGCAELVFVCVVGYDVFGRVWVQVFGRFCVGVSRCNPARTNDEKARLPSIDYRSCTKETPAW